MMLKVKICGITRLKDALLASNYGADALGLIFVKKSPRYITPASAKKIIDCLGPFITKVGVFQNEDKNKVLKIASYLRLDALQFHGDESPSYCNFFKKKFKIIKVIFPRGKDITGKVSSYDVDAFLFDLRYEDKLKGITTIPQEALRGIKTLIKKGVRVIVSGGLNTNNIFKIKRMQPYAVDVSSGIEKKRRQKDKKLLELFIDRAKR